MPCAQSFDMLHPQEYQSTEVLVINLFYLLKKVFYICTLFRAAYISPVNEPVDSTLILQFHVVERVQQALLIEPPATMRPSFLSRLRFQLYSLWFLCGEFLFGTRSFASAGLPVWSDEVDKYSTRLPMLASKLSSRAAVDDVNGKSKGQSIASSQTVGELLSILAGGIRERTGHLRLHQQIDEMEVPPMSGVYDWSNHFQLPEQGKGVVSFSVDCSNDVHVAMSSQPQSMDPMYEFVIGGWSNTTSVVRRRSQGLNLATVPVGMKKSRVDTVNDLWISIDKITKLLHMGYGREPSLESTILIYKDLQFLSEARYVCFSSWNVPVTYSDITVCAME